MFQLQAPWPGSQTTSVLPNPTFGNQQSLRASVSVRRALDGTRYTYVKRKGGWKLQWTFRLTRNKGLELRAFLQSYFASKIRVTDHTGRVWVGNLTNNPFEFDTVGRSGPAIVPMPRGEWQSITLEFRGELTSQSPALLPGSGYYVPNQPQLPATPEKNDYLSAETDAEVVIGQPIYVKVSGHVDLASAQAAPQVVGIAISDASVGFAVKYVTEGKVTRTDWTPVLGTASLSPGLSYFLDPVAGHLTATAPTAQGQYVVRVGRAVSPDVLDVEIELPILL